MAKNLGITKVGTSKNEKMLGYERDDQLSGFGGNDTLRSSAGNDTLDGGTDNDWLDGGAGNDVLIGGNYNDTLDGGSGNDKLDGGSDIDKLDGGNGKDTLDGGKGRDSMTGGDGDDYYFVENRDDVVIETNTNAKIGGVDTVQANSNYTLGDNVENLVLMESVNGLMGSGNKLNNAIIGTLSDDSLNGMAGDDTLNGSEGDDTLDGGNGKDTAVFNYSMDNYKIVPNEDTKQIVIEYVGSDTNKDGGDYLTNIEILQFSDGSYDAVTMTLIDAKNETKTTDSQIKGTSVRDLLFGTEKNDVLLGLAGDDRLRGNAGNDTLDGGTENDSLDGGGGNDSLTGGDGEDALFGGMGNDKLDGGKGNDTIDGGAGNDTLLGGSGFDSMNGGDGDDYYFVDNAKDTVTEMNTNVMMGGVDTVESSLNYTLGKNVENLTLKDIGGMGHSANGNAGANVIMGDSGDDVLNGMAGNDTLNGGIGDDTLDGGKGSDLLIGGAGDDLYIINNTDDLIVEIAGGGTYDGIISSISFSLNDEDEVENLMLSGKQAIEAKGNDLNNILQEAKNGTVDNKFGGGAGNDTIDAGGGNDTLEGGEGDDELDGGIGIDTVIFAGVMDDYNISVDSNESGGVPQIFIQDIIGGDGRDILTNVEYLEFADSSYYNTATIELVGVGMTA